MRALVLGGTGMLGRAVVAQWRRQDQPVLGLSHAQADITRRAALVAWVDAFRPEVVVNCAAFTAVDACESERVRAFAVNGQAVAEVAAAAASVGARLVHVSSDYVFNGQASRPWPEDAATGPISVYGESKLQGEHLALASPDALVVRASWLFGPGGPNFVRTLRGLVLGRKTPLRVVDDQVGCPTYTPYLARALWDLVRAKQSGLVHYGNREPVSWFGFAREIAEIVDRTVEVVPVSTSEFPRPARRPAYSVLDVSRFEAVVGRRVERWTAGLAGYLDHLGESS